MWTKYRVRWDGLNHLCGSVPADPKLVEAWLTARRPTARPPDARSIDELQAEVFDSLAAPDDFDTTECAYLTFRRDKGILAMRAATIRAHLKDCARVLSSYMGRLEGAKHFSTRIVDCVYPDPAVYWVPILRPDGSPVTEPDRTVEKGIRVQTPRGPRSALKKFDAIEPWAMEFTLHILQIQGSKPVRNPETKQMEQRTIPSVSIKDLSTVMAYGSTHGYAGERGDGAGKYTFTITEEV